MFIIKWIRPREIGIVITGLSLYASQERADLQVKKFRALFPENRYFVVPI